MAMADSFSYLSKVILLDIGAELECTYHFM